MKKNATLRIVLYSVLILILGGFLIGGLTLRNSILPVLFFDDDRPEAQGNQMEAHKGSVPAQGIRKLDISWASGSITVLPGDTDEIQFSEQATDTPMTWYTAEGTLVLSFQKTPWNFSRVHKDLTVTVPKDWAGEEISVDAASSKVKISDLTFRELEIDGASNEAILQNCTVEEISLDGASNRLELEGSLNRLDIDGATTRCILHLSNQMQEIEVDGVSTNLSLTVPEDFGFTLDSDGLSVDLDTDFPVTALGKNHYTVGNGDCKISVDGVSCDIEILKAK